MNSKQQQHEEEWNKKSRLGKWWYCSATRSNLNFLLMVIFMSPSWISDWFKKTWPWSTVTVILILATIALLLFVPSSADAQGLCEFRHPDGPTCSIEQSAEDSMTREDLKYAILRRLTLRYDNDANPFYASTCRRDRHGCEARINAIVSIIVHESNRNNLDPWIIAGMIWKESRFYPFARGGVNERGVMQLHPRNRRFRSVTFVHSPWYRRRCRQVLGNCQEEIIRAGASLLRSNIDSCEGNLYKGLTQYNTGRCTARRNRYARGVMEHRRVFLELSAEDGC